MAQHAEKSLNSLAQMSAKNSLAQMSAKNSTQTTLTLQAKGSASSKGLMTLAMEDKQPSAKSSKAATIKRRVESSSLEDGYPAKFSAGKPKNSNSNDAADGNVIIGDVKASIEDGENGVADPQTGVVISGDDILIEYCERIRHALRQVPDARVRPAQQAQLIRFITHYVWQMPDKVPPNSQWTKNVISSSQNQRNLSNSQALKSSAN